MESMDTERSKTDLRMFLRCLDQFLTSDKYPIDFRKKSQKSAILISFAIFTKLRPNVKYESEVV